MSTLSPSPRTAGALTRRSWLKLAGAAFGALATAGGVAWLNRERFRWLDASGAARVLREHYAYLKLEVTDEDMERFYAAYSQHYGKAARGGLYRALGRRPKSYYDDAFDELATTFLLSTDFFLNGADESRPVRYVTLYHPYASPCWNPISMAAMGTATREAETT